MVGSRGASMLKIITSDKNSYPTCIGFWGVRWGWIIFGTGRGEGEEVEGIRDVNVAGGFGSVQLKNSSDNYVGHVRRYGKNASGRD